MFDFRKYSQLIECHKAYVKYQKKSTHLVVLSVEEDSLNAKKKFHKLTLEIDDFYLYYERMIFNVFVKIKPTLINRRTNLYESWENVFGDIYDKIPERNRGCLVCAVEEAGGIYRFTQDYYNPNLTDNML